MRTSALQQNDEDGENTHVKKFNEVLVQEDDDGNEPRSSALVQQDDDVESKDHDLRKGFTYPGYKTKTIRLILFALLKLFLPFLDFVTDVNMLFQFGIPVIFGYQLCVEKSSGYANAAFGSVPEWSIDGEVCGYVDNRYNPSTTIDRRRKLKEQSQSSQERQLTHVTSADSVSVRGRQRRLVEIDTAEQTNDCTGLTTEDTCIAVDKCRWDILPNDNTLSCFDPVLESFQGLSVVLEQDRFLELYCNQFQPMHRGENTTHFNETLNICLSWSLSNGIKACDWDPYHQFCAPATSFFWKETPDNCARLGGGDGSGPGTYNENINSSCSLNCNCIYVSIDGSANGYQCMDRMAYAYTVSPYSTIGISWNTQEGYCQYMNSTCCSSFYFEGDTAQPACCTPGVNGCSYPSNSNSQCNSANNQVSDYHNEHCLPEQGCLPAALSAMYSEEALRGRYCDQCARCSDELHLNQATKASDGGDIYDTTAARTEAYVTEWSARFSCCSCDRIGNGKMCSIPETFDYGSTEFADYATTCDQIGQIPDTIFRGDSSTYEFKAYNTFARDSFNCRSSDAALVEDSEICQGLLTYVEKTGTDYSYGGITCTSWYNIPKKYVSLDSPQTCKARYETDVATYFENNLGMYECYNSSDFSEFGCMDFEEMKTYYKMKEENDWYNNPSANTYTYNSCRDTDVFSASTYVSCCFTAISTTCSSYTVPSCPAGCTSYNSITGTACYDPVQAMVNGGDTHVDSSWYCYWIENEADCISFQDPTSSSSPAQTLCEWDDSRVGRNDQDVQNTAKCIVRTDRTLEGTCLGTGSNCACVQPSNDYFKSPYSNDLKCPHKSYCYLPMLSECPIYNNGGYLSSWTDLDTAYMRWASRWSYASLSCYQDDANGGYHISSVDTYNEGCGGFKASFGCYVDGSKDDSVTIGDVLVSPLQLVMFCGGNRDDECRRCNAINIFAAQNVFATGGEFNYGDAYSNAGDTGYTTIITTIFMVCLLALVFIKEVLGLYIIANMTIHMYRTEGKLVSRDYDYITVGKDSIVGLIALLFLCIVLYRDEGWAGIGLYQVRYKLLEDGWSVEELEEKFENEKEEYLRYHPSQKVVIEEEEPKGNMYNRIQAMENSEGNIGSYNTNEGEGTPGRRSWTVELVETGREEEDLLKPIEDGDHDKDAFVRKTNPKRETSEGHNTIGFEQWVEKMLGVVHHVDEMVIPPLCEPETIMFSSWNVLELMEVMIGLVTTCLLLFTVGSLYYIKGEGSAPPHAEILATLFAFVTSLADLVFNILGGFCHCHSWLKWVKRTILAALFSAPLVLAALIYMSIYDNDACV